MLNLRNPYIMAPVKLGFSDVTGKVNDRHLSFYEERSEYIGAIIPEPFYLHPGLREIPTQLGIDSDDKLPGLQKLVRVIHSKGAKVIAHLNHPGRMANPKIPGNYYISSTDKPCENGGAIPLRMKMDEMNQVIRLFVSAAKRAEKAGFDGIELQFGHGYLLAQFLSAAVNDREDSYGGSLENRMKFPLEVFDAVKAAVQLPIIVRISGEEMISTGIQIDEMIQLAKILKQKGVAAIHVSAGTVCSTPPWFFQHMFVPKGKTWEFAARIKEASEIQTIFVGRIHLKEDITRVFNTWERIMLQLEEGWWPILCL